MGTGFTLLFCDATAHYNFKWLLQYSGLFHLPPACLRSDLPYGKNRGTNPDMTM